MGDPVSERAHYLAVEGEGTGDFFLIQAGRVEPLGLVRAVRRRAKVPPRPTAPPSSAVGRAIACILILFLAVAA